ncbi:orotidine-5'-phosphate decarboxylase [Hyphomicrobium sp.]|jgi:orotidine-5'-phosphate decarboxylase|uniref:orotidine-5'-phosphate decarboxylase n=1 Tax=Hyphomicrobium sp. TaxID=82 RepID=UPI002B71030B|nr:orotidine-5'-phosphate decarboxylase [Hyphomicrobium sp.]HVZ05583.1 orotidine-5'-phosphate decarboxylase [Hyphomicrobium sp.]
MAFDASGESGFQDWVGDVPHFPQSQAREAEAKKKLVVALDKPTVDEARKLIKRLAGNAGVFKIGLELVMSEGGLKLARDLRADGHEVFLDMKLLDIGNTIKKAVANVARSKFNFLTVHGKNRKALDAAVAGRLQALDDGAPDTLKLLAVTVLTDQSQDDLLEEGLAGWSPLDLAVHRAKMADAAGFDGVIASGREAEAIRAATRKGFIIKVPGVRPVGYAAEGQTRSVTPAEAIKAGADYVVVGRPIYNAEHPADVAKQIIDEIAQALADNRF